MLNLLRHTVSTRWLAGMLAPVLLWCNAAAAIDPAAAARLASCLQVWGITWKHPYFPSFEQGYCPAESAQSAAEPAMFSGLPNRRQKVPLAYRTDWFGGLATGASAGVLRDEGARLAFVHVEQLLLAQQFVRMAGPAKPTDGTFPAASYEKSLRAGIHRVDVHTRMDSVEMVFEQRGALRAELALPAPADAFDITAPGTCWTRVAALPNGKSLPRSKQTDKRSRRPNTRCSYMRRAPTGLTRPASACWWCRCWHRNSSRARLPSSTHAPAAAGRPTSKSSPKSRLPNPTSCNGARAPVCRPCKCCCRRRHLADGGGRSYPLPGKPPMTRR